MIIIFPYMSNAGSLPTPTHKPATTSRPMTACQVTSLLFTFCDIAYSISCTETTDCRNFMCSHIQFPFSLLTQINLQLVGARLKIKRMKPILELFQPKEQSMKIGSVSSPLCVWKLERVCSQTQLCQLRCFNDYTRQLHVLAPTGYLQVVFTRT